MMMMMMITSAFTVDDDESFFQITILVDQIEASVCGFAFEREDGNIGVKELNKNSKVRFFSMKNHINTSFSRTCSVVSFLHSFQPYTE